MLYEAKERDVELEPPESGAASITGPLPGCFVLTERAVAALRAYLVVHDLTDYRIFVSANFDLHDIDTHLKLLGEEAEWEAAPSFTTAGQPADLLSHDSGRAWSSHAGFLRLDRHQAVLARWYWIDDDRRLARLWLCAAPSPEHYFKLRSAVDKHRHAHGAAVWQVLRNSYDRGERVARDPGAGDELLLSPALRQRLEIDIIRFFSDEVVRLYRSLGVPHRRGVLLHGPPGNGKTSIIRAAGAALPKIPAMILRPSETFDTDELETILDRWRRQAPAMLVIEDLNWLLERTKVSTFLNLLDGIDSNLTGGLLLIATTNYPEKLDPAINNRPGRFDVVIEVPCPDRVLRQEFLSRKLPGMDEAAVRSVVETTEGMSFAHLQEVLRFSGLLAIAGNRTDRLPEDLVRAAEAVRQGHEDAARGFCPKPEMPFGLAAYRDRRR